MNTTTSLTTSQVTALRALYEGKSKVHAASVAALVKRGLVSAERTLTEEGVRVAASLKDTSGEKLPDSPTQEERAQASAPAAESFALLIWQLVPEECNFYLIPTAEAEKYQHFLVQAHGKFLNASEDSDGLHFLNTALSEEYAEEGYEKYAGIFVPYKVSNETPLSAPITTVYSSGFIL